MSMAASATSDTEIWLPQYLVSKKISHCQTHLAHQLFNHGQSAIFSIIFHLLATASPILHASCLFCAAHASHLQCSTVSAAWLHFISISCLSYAPSCLSLAGPKWGPWCVWPCQWANLIGALISVFIQSGESFQVSLLNFRILPFDDPTTKLGMLLLLLLGLIVDPRSYPGSLLILLLSALLVLIVNMTFGHIYNISLSVLWCTPLCELALWASSILLLTIRTHRMCCWFQEHKPQAGSHS